MHIPGGESAVRWRRGITDQEDQRGGPAPLLPPVNEGYLSRWMGAGEVMTSNSPDGEHLKKSLWQILVELKCFWVKVIFRNDFVFIF